MAEEVLHNEYKFGALPDLDVQSKDNVIFHVNRTVLMEASPVWRTMLLGSSTSKMVRFNEDPSQALHTIFSILYGTHDVNAPIEEGDALIVEKYNLDGVKKVLELKNKVQELRTSLNKSQRKLKHCQEFIEESKLNQNGSLKGSQVDYKTFPSLGSHVGIYDEFTGNIHGNGVIVRNDEDDGTDLWVLWDGTSLQKNVDGTTLAFL